MDDTSRGNHYALDQNGKEVLLSSEGQQVMMEWEKPYMQELVKVLRIDPTCDVLEVGFGCGYSASCIQSYHPQSHTIIECDQLVIERLEKWANDKPSVKIVKGLWQVKLPELPEFDCIFFDDYPLPEIYPSIPMLRRRSRWYDFLDHIVHWHSRINTRVTGYLAQHLDLTYPDCTVTINKTKVTVPKNCEYYLNTTAFVPLLVVSKMKQVSKKTAHERSTRLRVARALRRVRSSIIEEERHIEEAVVVQPKKKQNTGRTQYLARLRERANEIRKSRA